MLVNFDNVAFGYGDNLIFGGVSFTLHEGSRTALIGANGAGKTTLIKLLTGALDADKGAITKKNGIKLGWLEQNGGYESGATVYEEALKTVEGKLAAVKKLEDLSAQLCLTQENTREYAAITAKIENLNGYIAANDCYNAEVKVKTVLNGMGFAERYDQVIGTMSGGEKTRFKLARLLLEEPDLLVLDEPTNHLDAKTLYWLEDFLQTFKGATFVVSHDRYFLDRTADRILELENGELLSFKGNYTKYKSLKADYVALKQKEYEKQQEEIAKLNDYVARNIVRATTAKSAQSRVKQLEKMEVLQKPYTPPRPPVFRFEYGEPSVERALTMRDLTLTAGDKTLFTGGNLEVKRGEKIALVGENGTGKSTLIKLILSANSPAITVGRGVKFAAYDQENANLNPENTVLGELWERHVAYTQTDVRAELARCGLFAEDMQKQVKSLSGGERAKLALCVFESEQGNFLLLDEPTNHLDLPARESLESALKSFDGTAIFVSHDRYFIAACADRIIEIEDKKLKVYNENYENYITAKRGEREKLALEEAEKAQKAFYENKEINRRSAKARAEEARKKERARALEKEILRLENEENELNQKLATPQFTADYAAVNAVCARLEEIKGELAALYDEYGNLI